FFLSFLLQQLQQTLTLQVMHSSTLFLFLVLPCLVSAVCSPTLLDQQRRSSPLGRNIGLLETVLLQRNMLGSVPYYPLVELLFLLSVITPLPDSLKALLVASALHSLSLLRIP